MTVSEELRGKVLDVALSLTVTFNGKFFQKKATLMLRLVLANGACANVLNGSLAKLGLFRSGLELLDCDEYAIKCDVCKNVLDLFMARFHRLKTRRKVTTKNAEQLWALSDELGFSGFDAELESVLGNGKAVEKDIACLMDRVKGLEALVQKQQHLIIDLERDLRRQNNEQRNVHNKAMTLKTMVEEKEQVLCDKIDEVNVTDDVRKLKRNIRRRVKASDVRLLQKAVSELKAWQEKQQKACKP